MIQGEWSSTIESKNTPCISFVCQGINVNNIFLIFHIFHITVPLASHGLLQVAVWKQKAGEVSKGSRFFICIFFMIRYSVLYLLYIYIQCMYYVYIVHTFLSVYTYTYRAILW